VTRRNPKRDPNWITLADIAEIVGVDRTTVWRVIQRGGFASVQTYKPSATTYYWEPDVRAWVKARTNTPTVTEG